MDIQETPTLEGDELLLRQAIGNPIANAIDFSPSGAVIEVHASATGQNVTIMIRDYRTGMPDFALAKAFDKFFSLNRPDTGKKARAWACHLYGRSSPCMAEKFAREMPRLGLRRASRCRCEVWPQPRFFSRAWRIWRQMPISRSNSWRRSRPRASRRRNGCMK